MKPRLVGVALAVAALAGTTAGCAGSGQVRASSPPSRTGAGILPTGGAGSAPVDVTCRDATSDAATLQRAVNASAVGSTVSIGGPVCLLTTGVTLLPGRTYEGGSTAGTVLKQDAGMRFVLATSAYTSNASSTGGPLSIRDLTVACDGSGHTDGIIVVNWLTDVEHVYVRNCGGSGIVDSSETANGSLITSTSVNSRFDNNFISNSGQYGFYVEDPRNAVTDGYLVDNQIADSRTDAIHLDDAAGWDVTGNHLYGVGHSAIYASRLYGTTISGNYIEDFGAGQASGTWFGIEATAQGDVGSTISGNKVFNASGRPGASHVYIGVTRVNFGTSYLAVTGNLIVGPGSGVGFLYAGGGHHLVVASSGNVVAGVSTTVRRGGDVTVTPGT